jgi:hypothetical protein
MSVDMKSARELARAVIRRTDAQPLPLSVAETYLLALALLEGLGDDAHTAQFRGPSDVAASKANTRQVAGQHYGLSNFQHWDMVVMFKLDYFQGQITKYVMRWREKNGVVDLQKAAHFLEKYIECAEGNAFQTPLATVTKERVSTGRPGI